MDLERGAILVFKCRRCGCLDKTTHAPRGHTAASCIVYGYKPPEEWFGMLPRMNEMHLCKDGNLGVTDFIGVEYDKAE